MSSLCLHIDTELGPISLFGTEAGLSNIRFQAPPSPQPRSNLPEYMYQAQEQLLEYLQGQRTTFAIPLDYAGTRFQVRVWQTLCQVPYGQAVSYGDIAQKVGNPRGGRAVGGANNKNPLPIVIPCHRVVGHDGRLVGYGSGLWRKIRLLEIEGMAVDHSRKQLIDW